MSEPTTTYDELPYDDKPIRATHPDNLAAIATLYGMTPAALPRCHVLELGCAAGQNLMAMAIGLPDASFTGIDLSPRQVADGQATVKALGLANVTLTALSLLDVDDSFGQFDYVIAHGVYSWVPPGVQDKLLAVCARNLAPRGVAYVSYNTYPGWHQRGMVREMMGYHVRQFTEPRQRVEQARAFLTFLIDGQAHMAKETTYQRTLTDEAETLKEAADSYVFHEHLEDVNQPLYFHEFMDRAAGHGLQYLQEARPHIPIESMPAATREALDELADDVVRLEQYLDFLRNRTFRRTLLCHAAQPLDREHLAERLRGLRFTATAFPPTPDIDVAGATEVEFRGEEVKVSTNTPAVKATALELSEAWPRAVPFDLLRERVWERLKDGTVQPVRWEEMAELLSATLYRCWRANLTRPHVYSPPFILEISERPRASPLARLQAAKGLLLISNLWHAFVRLDERERSLLALLDGSRDHAALGADLTAEERDRGWPGTTLHRFARMGLLIG